jgi:hypothetical protein
MILSIQMVQRFQIWNITNLAKLCI